MADNRPTFIEVTGTGVINFGYHSRFIIEEDGTYSWYIPAYKMFFSSKTKEEGQQRGISMVKSFFMFWDKQNSYRGLILEIHNLGFRVPQYHNLTVSELIRKKRTSAKFNSTENLIPESFAAGTLLEQEGSFAMAS